MRDYGKVSPQFWIGSTGKQLRAAGMEAQIVAMYLMTCPHANMLGLYYLPKLYIAHETGLGEKGASKGLARAIEAGFCAYDEASEMVWVFEMARYQIADQLKPDDKRCVGIQNEYNALPANPHLEPFFEKYAASFNLTKKRQESTQTASPIEAPSKPHRSQEQEQEQEQEEHPCASADARDRPGRATTSDGFEQFWAAYPKRVSKGAARKAWAKLKPSEQLLQAILAGIGRAKTSAQWLRDDGRFVPHPATWLNAEGWLDDPPTSGANPDDQWWLGRGFGTRESAIAAGVMEPA